MKGQKEFKVVAMWKTSTKGFMIKLAVVTEKGKRDFWMTAM
jgi:hypothetical protein